MKPKLIDFLIVLCIIGILGSMLFPTYLEHRRVERVDKVILPYLRQNPEAQLTESQFKDLEREVGRRRGPRLDKADYALVLDVLRAQKPDAEKAPE